jgi:hypothetical protein
MLIVVNLTLVRTNLFLLSGSSNGLENQLVYLAYPQLAGLEEMDAN